MAKDYFHLLVVLADDLGDPGSSPYVRGVFESRRKAEDFVAEMNAEQSPMRYYMDISYNNVFED
jgi:hypothetical protein